MTEERTVAELAEALRIQQANFEERIVELELELEDRGWSKLSGADEKEFTRDGLRKICHESFLFYMKNPLVKRAVDTQANYVFGQGITIKAAHPLVDEVVQSFLTDKKNQKQLTSVIAMTKAEKDLWIDANLFPVFFKSSKGDVRLAVVKFDEIEDIRTNPEDKNEPWLYLRRWNQTRDTRGRLQVLRREWYPDIDYRPDSRVGTEGGPGGTAYPVNWDTPMMHVKTNVMGDQKFGTSEIYAAQDWAAAYNKFLSDWATIVRSYARFAWEMVKKTGSAGRLAAKARLDSKISSDQYQPAPAAGSVFISDADTKMAPIRTAGATTSADDGRRLLLMVCAATGTFEHFMGDPSTGNLATAKTLNRPMELQYANRQRLWEIVWEAICEYVIQCKAEIGYRSGNPDVKGFLTGEWENDAWKEETFVYAADAENEDEALRTQPIDTTVNVDFPKLVEHDVNEMVKAIVSATTLDGNAPAGTLKVDYATEQLLRALGETSIEEVMERMFPEGEEPEEVAIAGAVQDLQQAIEALSESRGIEQGEVVKALAETFVLAFKGAFKEASDAQ